MLIFNNLLINNNSDKFQPFLVNLLSGRRRLLSNYEAVLVKNMSNQDQSFSIEEKALYEKLISEKQFLTNSARREIENKLVEMGFFNIQNKYAKDYGFSIELTRFCNMSCPYCYAHSRLNKGKSMTKKHVDAIYDFYRIYADEQIKIYETPYIRITGGEPLINQDTVDVISYIASKWEKAKILLFTNGVNLLKYYDKLPLDRFGEVHVSLDGTKDVHIHRRYNNINPDTNIYENILSGVQKLISDKVNVKIKMVLDKTNYLKVGDFKKLLEERGILDSPYCEILPGITLDYHHPLDIMEDSNSKLDIEAIQSHLIENQLAPPLFPSYSRLFKVLSRSKNEPYLPKHRRCESEFLSKYYFSCNGNIYFCDCFDENDGIVGTFYPNINLDETAISNLLNRSVLQNKKCNDCAYKFVCLGGCPISARTKQVEMACGIYSDEVFLDNLEFNYYWIK
ncbi:radical SAM domain-containing protein [Clostridium putrefaciens]|uniref:Radical SAM domain-containing protein n=1 Tax=Clostridium putrefaciens TaxID=99675 RepID=A0A381J5C2_9CLOT|nr:radical SAM protein [Clostridium putrefaciens]SUY46504.1 radical SAM domain-containing protein [Clostridium putrefaciens]